MNEEKKPKIFVDGMIFDRPNEKAPEWVKGKISINTKNFAEWLKQYSTKEWLNIDLKLSQNTGKLYLELNTYEPKQVIPEVNKTISEHFEENIEDDIKIKDIPF